MENKTPEQIMLSQIELAKAKFPDENWMSPEQILASPEFSFIINALKEYGDQQWNQAVFNCINNIRIIKSGNSGSWMDASVDVQSISKLLK